MYLFLYLQKQQFSLNNSLHLNNILFNVKYYLIKMNAIDNSKFFKCIFPFGIKICALN